LRRKRQPANSQPYPCTNKYHQKEIQKTFVFQVALL
jgi:hypothetical protein